MTSGAELSAVRANWGKAKALFAVSGWDKHMNAPPRSARPHGASSSAICRSFPRCFLFTFSLFFYEAFCSHFRPRSQGPGLLVAAL